MQCSNCGGPVQYPKLYRSKRFCSHQCREMAEKREREKTRREWLVGDECNCTQCLSPRPP